MLAGQLIAGPLERSTELAAGDCLSFAADVAHLFAAGVRPVARCWPMPRVKDAGDRGVTGPVLPLGC